MIVRVINKEESVLYQGIIYKYGDEPFEMDDAIAKSLIERGYVENSVESSGYSDNIEDNMLTVDKPLAEMSYQELKKLAGTMKIDATGKKDELVDRLKNYVNEPDIEEAVAEDDLATDEETEDAPNTSMPE